MKTIIIPLSLGTTVRNIMRTDAFATFKKSGAQLIILTPAFDEPTLLDEFRESHIIFEPLHQYIPKRFESVLMECAIQIFYKINRINTFEIRRKTHPKGVISTIIYWFIKIAPVGRASITCLQKINAWLFPDKVYGNLFEKYHPDLLFSTHPYDLSEIPLIKRANQNHIPIVSMILSWDNITSHPLLPTRFKKVIVWSQFMKEQLSKYYRYADTDVLIAGIPQFDIYFDKSKLKSREEFFSALNIDKNLSLITYTTSPTVISPNEPEIIEIIYQAIQQKKISRPCQLLVRFHPRDTIERYNHLRKYNIIFDQPGRRTSHYNDHWNPDTSDMRHLAETMMHSNVVINVASTITIDASAFDTPVINIGFDGYHHPPYLKSILRYYYDYTHYIEIMKTKGFWLVKNDAELIEAINAYLKNPQLHAEGRQQIIKQFCYKIDGQSARRLANFVLDELRKP